MFKTFVSPNFFFGEKKGGLTFNFKKNGHKNVFRSSKNSFSFFNWGGGGKNDPPKRVCWGDGFENNPSDFSWLISLIFLQLNDFFSSKILEYQKKKTKNKFYRIGNHCHFVFRNCELLSAKLISKITKLIPFHPVCLRDKIRTNSLINRWYEKEKFFFSSIYFEKEKNSLQSKIVSYNCSEPRIRKIRFFTNEKNQKSIFFWISGTKLWLLKKILKIESGSLFRWETEVWEKKFKGELFDNGKINVQSFKTAEKIGFLDVFIEITKIPTKKLEPEILVSNESLSGSFSFSDSNLLGLGLIFKNKISKNDQNRNILQIEMFSHLQEYGGFSLLQEKKGGNDTKFTLSLSKNFKKLMGSSVNLDLQKKKKFQKNENSFSLSLMSKRFKLEKGRFLSKGFTICSSKKNKQKIRIQTGLLFEMEKNLGSVFNDVLSLKVKVSNFFQFDIQRFNEIFNLNVQTKEAEILDNSLIVINRFKKKTLIELTANLEDYLSSFIFFETKIDLASLNPVKKDLNIGFKIKNLLNLQMIFSGDGRKKIFICLN